MAEQTVGNQGVESTSTMNEEQTNCDHEWEFHDDSFDHEFGCEQVYYWTCEKCGMTTDKCPYWED